jgi:ABC-2 type transport system permease protein
METPLVFLLLFPSYMFWPLVQNPEGTMVVAGSYFPFFTPFVMYARMCVGEAGFLEATLGAGIMLVAIFVNVLLVSAIYRAGFLIYGKRPSFMEIGKAIVFSLSLPVPKLAFLKPRKAQTEAR